MLSLRLIAQAAVFTTTILLGRILGPEEFGAYSYIFYGFLLFFTLFNVSSMNDLLMREIASNPERRRIIYQSGLALQLVAGLSGLVAALAVVWIWDIFPVPLWIAMIACLTLFTSFSTGSVRMVWDVPYQVDFRMSSASAVSLFSKGLFLSLLLAWFWMTKDGGASIPLRLTTVIILHITSELCGVIVQGVINRRYGYPMLPRWDPRTIRFLVTEVWSLAIAGVLLLVKSRVFLLLLPMYVTERDVGLFAAPMRLVEALYIVPSVFVATLMPILSRIFRESRTEFERLVGLGYRLMILCSVAVAGVVNWYARDIVTLLYGVEYADAGTVMAVYIWVGVVAFAQILFHSVLIAAGEQRLMIPLYSIQAGFTLMISLIVIPAYGITGAVVALLAIYFILFPMALFFVRIRFAGMLWLKALPTPVATALLAGYAAKAAGIDLWAAVPAIPIVLLVVMYAVRWIDRNDLRLILSIARYKNVTPVEH